MTPDQIIRAVDYVLAVWSGDDEAQARLDVHHYGQQPTRHLLAAFLDLAVASVAALEASGENTPPSEQGQTRAVAGVLVQAVNEWAQTAAPDDTGAEIPDYTQASEGIARTVAAYFLAVVDGPPGELKPRLEGFRKTAATIGGEAG